MTQKWLRRILGGFSFTAALIILGMYYPMQPELPGKRNA